MAVVRSPIEDAADAASARSDSRLNPKYTFDNFVIGQSNRFAHAAAVAVAEAPAKAYNPLFIYGDSGLGKTHLLHAIGHYAMSLYSGHPCPLRQLARSSRTTSSTRSPTTAASAVPVALPRHRHPPDRRHPVPAGQGRDPGSVLPHLQHAPRSQQAGRHHERRAAQAPHRLRRPHAVSRFEWGLITDVQAPDLETRIAILRKKAQSEKLQIPDEILEYIATEGVVATSASSRARSSASPRSRASTARRSTWRSCRPCCKDLITLDDDNVIAPVDIIIDTADYFKLSVDDLYGSSRSQAVATARQIAMYLCRELTNLSLPKIGQLFGNRDHTTVMYANKKISELMKERRSIYNQVSEITAQLGRNGR